MPHSKPAYLSPYQLHKRWAGAISPKTLANWRSKHIGPDWVKIGGRVLYPIEAVLAYEESASFIETASIMTRTIV